MLYNFRPLTSDASKRLSALWGRLSAEIMQQNFDSAKEVLTVLENNIKGACVLAYLVVCVYVCVCCAFVLLFLLFA